MIAARAIVKQARHAAGLSQADLAERMGTTQSAVARLESSRSNPRIETLERAVAATGNRLTAKVEPGAGLDESLIADAMRIEPADRLRHFASAYRSARRLSEAGRRSLGP